MADNWIYVEKEGEPKAKGNYVVTLISPWGNKTVAEVATRWFSPENGWDEPCGSILGEKVYAWMPVEMSEIPDGVCCEDELCSEDITETLADTSSYEARVISEEEADAADKAFENDNRYLYLVGKTGDRESVIQLDSFQTVGFNIKNIFDATPVDRFEIRLASKEDIARFDIED